MNILKVGLLLFATIFLLGSCSTGDKNSKDSWKLQWSDEFDYEGAPDPEKWAVRHYDEGQPHKDLAVVENGNLELSVKKIDGIWRCAYLSTNNGRGAIGGDFDRKMFAPPKGGQCRLEIKFKGVNAKGTGPMVSGMQTGIWLFSKITQLPGYTPEISAMRGEIDMIEHASPSGGKNYIASFHITEFPGLKWKEFGNKYKVKSSVQGISPTNSGDRGYYNSTEWQTVAAEWSEDSVKVFLNEKLVGIRTNLETDFDSTLNGLRVRGNKVPARYFAFDHEFPLGLRIASFLHREPGRPWRGIGPADDEPTDYEAMPFTMYYDYVRFYTKKTE